MAKVSAGLLMYRVRSGAVEVLLVHPGGPFSKNKDAGAWSIPKGEVADGEELLEAARREFAEELGLRATGVFIDMGSVKQKSGKVVHAWVFEGDCDPATVRSNTFELEWPPNSGMVQEFPEIDRAASFDLPTARRKIISAQAEFLDRLAQQLPDKTRR